MAKSLIKSVLLVIAFVLTFKFYSFIALKIFTSDYFLNLEFDLFWIDISDSFFYLIVISLLWWYFYYIEKDGVVKSFSIKTHSIFKVLLLALLFRIIEDPILHFYQIYGNVDFSTYSDYDTFSWKAKIVYTFNILVLIPLCEELIFRKGIIGSLSKYKLTAIVISSILFMSIHINDFSSLNYKHLLTVFLLGIILALIYLKYGLLSSFIFHSIGNLLWFIVEINKETYKKFIGQHDFGALYWIIIATSLVIFVFLVKKWILPRNKVITHNLKNEND